MTDESLRTRMLRGDMLAGTFLKTPNLQMIEILAMTGMDFVCLDAEHAPFDRSAIDPCMAIGRAMNFPILVRVPDGNPAEILKALDCGATGLVIPHVATPEKAANIAKWSRFGHGGRGYAGSSRWASYTTKTMPELLKQSAKNYRMSSSSSSSSNLRSKHLASVKIDETAYDVWKKLKVKPFSTGISFIDKQNVRRRQTTSSL